MELLTNLIDLIDREGESPGGDGRRAGEGQNRPFRAPSAHEVQGASSFELAHRVRRAARTREDVVGLGQRRSDLVRIGVKHTAALAAPPPW